MIEIETLHKVYNQSSVDMKVIKDDSVDLVVTSPPYPMVEMWDDCFKFQSIFVEQAFEKKMYYQAWIEMHNILENV